MLKYLFNPKGWLIGLLYLLLRAIALLPLTILMILGKWLGKLAYYVAPERKSIIRTNLSLCFPELSEKEQDQLIRANLISTTQGLFETLLAFWASDHRLKPLVTVSGLEHIKAALENKNGVVLLASHFTMLDLAARFIDMHLEQPLDMVYRAHNDAMIEGIIAKGRMNHCHDLIGKKSVVKFFEALRQNHVVWYAPDQNFKFHNVFVPFFGVPASTVTFTSTIAKQTGAAVIPILFNRKHNGLEYEIKLLPALDDFPSGDDTADTARILKIIEEQARKYPEQYLWSHRRFKTRPEGEPLIYPKKKRRKKS